jgi:MerR family copper efflux transcriptional regulator
MVDDCWVSLDLEPGSRVYGMSMGSLHISDLAERADVPVSTLRYYERIGLLPSPERSQNGYRLYDESAIEHLAFIGRAKRMGVPLEQVAELIELWSTGGCRPLQARIRSFLATKVAEIRLQRTELAEFEEQLENLFGRLEKTDGSPGLCDLDCACVHLDVGEDAGGGCARFPTASRGDIVCALPQDERSQRVEQWRDVLVGAAVEGTSDGMRIRFPKGAGMAERVARLCESEVACSSFFEFTMEIAVGEVELIVRLPDQPEARALAEMVFGPLPEPVRR